MFIKQFPLILLASGFVVLVTATLLVCSALVEGDLVGIIPVMAVQAVEPPTPIGTPNMVTTLRATFNHGAQTPPKHFARADELLPQVLANTAPGATTVEEHATENTRLSLDAGGKWSLITLFAGLVLTILWTVILKLYRRARLKRRVRDEEADAGRFDNGFRDQDIRDFSAATAMPTTPEPVLLRTSQELIDSPQHSRVPTPRLPPLDLPGPLALPMAHLPPPRR